MASKHAKISLRLDNGALIGHSTKLGGDPAGGTVLLPPDKAFSRGLLTVDQARRLEELLRDMHSRAHTATPLRSLPAASHKHALESAQVLAPAQEFLSGCLGPYDRDNAKEGPKMLRQIFESFTRSSIGAWAACSDIYNSYGCAYDWSEVSIICNPQ